MKIFISFIFVFFLICLSCINQIKNQEETSSDATVLESKNLKTGNELLPGLAKYLNGIEADFAKIPEKRKEQLKELVLYVKSKNESREPSKLVFICTHNSRRSHMSQLWAQTAAYHYGVKNVHCYSGGTEATAFNPRSVRALRKAGFNIVQMDSSSNPIYLVKYGEGVEPIKGFSKKYNDQFNPQDNFVAVMTCSHADKTCPLVIGATLRVAIPYEDPKVADNTPDEESKYDERCHQIATEMFYIFSEVKSI